MPATAPQRSTGTPEIALSNVPVYLPPVRARDVVELSRVGHMIYTPGVLPRWGDEIRYAGRVDAEVSVRNAVQAAELCVHNMIALLRAELGTLDAIQQVMQINVLVRCSEGFENISRVADGASTALYQVFSAQGRHHRVVMPTAELPRGSVVQVSGIFRIS
jgi:enamine deaminase RidA (YjgF/YER057c/UK114 family)